MDGHLCKGGGGIAGAGQGHAIATAPGCGPRNFFISFGSTKEVPGRK